MSEVICGNALEVLAGMKAESIHCCITSPPYWGLRSYGEGAEMVFGGEKDCRHEWGDASWKNPNASGGWQGGAVGGIPSPGQQVADYKDRTIPGSACSLCGAWRGQFGLEPTPEMYVEHTLEFLRAIRRVLRDDGCVWWNLGDSYAGSMKGYSPSGYQYGGPKQRTNVGSMGLPPQRAEDIGLKPKDLVMIPFRVALAAQADGWWVRSVIIWNKPNPMPESVTDRPTTSHEYVLLLTKSKSYFYDADAIREPHATADTDPRRRVTPEEYEAAKVGRYIKPGQNELATGRMSDKKNGFQYLGNPAGRNKRTVWTISTKPYPEAHFATFPPDLIEPMILTTPTKCCAECGSGYERVTGRATKPHPNRWSKVNDAKQFSMSVDGYHEGGTLGVAHEVTTLGFRPTCSCDADTKPAVILDPFAGTGTVAWEARKHGRDYVLIEIVPDYIPLINKRLDTVAKVVYAEHGEEWSQPRLT